ncbi:ankyrin [Stipitochalara longipes BDJ]|nr:ankyrin [Stipitochalara longipes BDJ]
MCATPSYLISLIKLGANANAVNNAGETFMHLLKPEVLSHCDDLCYLFELLRVQGFNFRQHDHLGQSPFHLLLRPWKDQDTLRKIITQMNDLPIHRHISTARDCFGYTVVAQLNHLGTDLGINLDHAILSLSCETDNSISNSRCLQTRFADSWTKTHHNFDEHSSRNYENHPYIMTFNDLFVYEQHVDYWRTILTAKDSPWFEDSNGRNGLHCLAATSLVTPEKPLPATLLSQLESLKDLGEGDETSERASFTKYLLNVGVDANNYDNDGTTPFMAFIIHHHATEMDDCITKILRCLVEAGSDIHRRNRHGETALHLAVKLGRRAATKFLLASGANIHARTRCGLGVLELGHKHSLNCKQDENLFAQIMLCMSLVATCGAVSEPTIIDEWGTPELKVVANKTTEPRGFKLVKKFIGIKVKRRRWGKASGNANK